MATHYHIYGNGGVAGAPVNYATPIATVTGGTSWATPALALNSSWRWGVRAFDSVSLLEETNVDAQVALVLNGAGLDVTHRPRPALGLTARPVAAGSIRVTWTYPTHAVRKPWKPTQFKVYAGTSGSPNYAAALATIVYDGRARFAATIGPYTHGQVVTVGVRATNGSGEETNVATVDAVAAVTGPSAVDGLAATATSRMSDV